MAEFYCYKGIKNGATFLLDSTTTTTIKDDLSVIVGKVVAITGNYTVGYGSAGDTPLGFVEQIEKESSNSDNYVVSVTFNHSEEDIACVGSETAGSTVFCDGSGGVKAATVASGGTAPTGGKATVWGVDATNKLCTVYISG